MPDKVVVVVRCVDSRFQDDEWVALMKKELGVHYTISCIGGVRSLLTDAGKRFLEEQLAEFKKIFGDEAFNRCHFVLVAHGECKAYGEYKAPKLAQNRDLNRAAKELRAAIRKLGHGRTGDPRISFKYLAFHDVGGPALIEVPSSDR